MELDPKNIGFSDCVRCRFGAPIFGFEPNVEQNAATQDAIRYLLALMPAGCYLIGAVLLLKYTFNEQEHRAVRAELDRMKSGRASDGAPAAKP